ncbi:acyltransferase family protein [Nonomuraea sp. NPDC050556]|uniref:acyltransferase family protein n=1 Tax=Nonomuraea sp. NPDC050556 TaxID=3364369 RepID=UPI0037888D42
MSGWAHRDDIEGLRAVAVLLVLGFHAAVPGLGGGFVGVDVFFVISGFLITGLILRDLGQGRFSLADFYARRARRILPAAGVVLVVTAVAGWVLLPGVRLQDLAGDVLTAALYIANWRFIGQQTDYLAAERDPSPLLHYWSLAVEEQFYLVWAPLALLAFWVAGRRLVGVLAVVLTGGSLALCLTWDGPAAYLASPSRAWQFGVGALAALATPHVTRLFTDKPPALTPPRSETPSLTSPRPGTPALTSPIGTLPRFLAALLGTAGVVALAWSLPLGETAYPGPEALAPTLGTAAIILFRSPISTLLSLPWLRFLGKLSFSWYLWHWPVLVLTEAALGQQPWPIKAALALASVLPSWLTLHLIENPVRLSPVVSARPRSGLAVGTAAMIIPVTAALLLGRAAVPDQTTTVTVAATAPTVNAAAARTDYPPSQGCEVALTATISPPCLFTPTPTYGRSAETGTGTNPGTGTDTGTGTRTSTGTDSGTGTDASAGTDASTGTSTRTGTTPGSERIVLIGDSHAGQWFTMARRIAQRRGWTLEMLTKPGCPLPTLTVIDPRLGREYHECDTWRENTLRRLESEPAPRLILFTSLDTYADPATTTKAWATTLERLGRIGPPLVYLRDTPMPGLDIPACLSTKPAAQCTFPRTQREDPLSKTSRPRIWHIQANDVLCPATTPTCPAELDGVVLYRDDSHLTNTAVERLAPRLEQDLEDLDLIPTVL